MICLIYDEDLVSNPLCTQKSVKVRCKFEQLVKPVAKRDNNRHTMITPRCIITRNNRRPVSAHVVQRVRRQYEVECADNEYASYRYQWPFRSFSQLYAACSCHRPTSKLYGTTNSFILPVQRGTSSCLSYSSPTSFSVLTESL